MASNSKNPEEEPFMKTIGMTLRVFGLAILIVNVVLLNMPNKDLGTITVLLIVGTCTIIAGHIIPYLPQKRNKATMWTIVLSFLILALPNIGKSVVFSPTHRYHVSYAPELTIVPVPENVTPEFLGVWHTTNPDKNWTNGDPLNEWGINELSWGYDVVLALDEEAVDRWGIDYSVRVVERSDESLVAQYYKDLRIREIVTRS